VCALSRPLEVARSMGMGSDSFIWMDLLSSNAEWIGATYRHSYDGASVFANMPGHGRPARCGQAARAPRGRPDFRK
jgi:hypothetical protein